MLGDVAAQLRNRIVHGYWSIDVSSWSATQRISYLSSSLTFVPFVLLLGSEAQILGRCGTAPMALTTVRHSLGVGAARGRGCQRDAPAVNVATM